MTPHQAIRLLRRGDRVEALAPCYKTRRGRVVSVIPNRWLARCRADDGRPFIVSPTNLLSVERLQFSRGAT